MYAIRYKDIAELDGTDDMNYWLGAKDLERAEKLEDVVVDSPRFDRLRFRQKSIAHQLRKIIGKDYCVVVRISE